MIFWNATPFRISDYYHTFLRDQMTMHGRDQMTLHGRTYRRFAPLVPEISEPDDTVDLDDPILMQQVVEDVDPSIWFFGPAEQRLLDDWDNPTPEPEPKPDPEPDPERGPDPDPDPDSEPDSDSDHPDSDAVCRRTSYRMTGGDGAADSDSDDELTITIYPSPNNTPRSRSDTIPSNNLPRRPSNPIVEDHHFSFSITAEAARELQHIAARNLPPPGADNPHTISEEIRGLRERRENQRIRAETSEAWLAILERLTSERRQARSPSSSHHSAQAIQSSQASRSSSPSCTAGHDEAKQADEESHVNSEQVGSGLSCRHFTFNWV